MHKTLLILFVVLSVVGCVRCQEEDDDGGSLWKRLKSMVRNFVDSMKEIFNQMKEEIKSRTVDMRDWSTEMFDSFKQKMREWVDQVGGASKTEKEDMRKYIERMEMPKGEE